MEWAKECMAHGWTFKDAPPEQPCTLSGGS